MKNLIFAKSAIILSLLVFSSSCKKEEAGTENRTAVKFVGQYHDAESSKAAKSANATNGIDVKIESFIINVGEIEVEFDDNDPLFATDSSATDFELEGPFEIDLMKNGNPLTNTIVSNIQLPEAAYDEIEFKFRESENSTSDMFGKSVLIKGTIDGTPFIFWSDEEIEVDIEFNELVYLDEASKSVLTVSFDLTNLFDPTSGGLDISTANDGNSNGIIEIHPDDPDGNEELAKLIWNKIEDIIEAFEEKNND